MSFASLKANRSQEKQALLDKLSKLNTNKASFDDDRFWKPEVDKAGNGHALIRFMPAPEGENFPFIRLWDHGFKGPGGWYIENSLTSIDKPDPVGELNSELWNSGSDAAKDQARKQKRRLYYIANILVVNDPAKPENNGKVFLYRFGKKIFDKINDAMNPEDGFEDEQPLNPFDMWEGADFKLKIRNVEGWTNYDKSEFASPSPISDNDSEMEKIYNNLYKLKPFLEESNFKSYDELKKKLDRVLGISGSRTTTNTIEEMSEKNSFDDDDDEDVFTSSKDDTPPWDGDNSSSSNDDDDDELAFFKNLAS